MDRFEKTISGIKVVIDLKNFQYELKPKPNLEQIKEIKNDKDFKLLVSYMKEKFKFEKNTSDYDKKKYEELLDKVCDMFYI